MGVHFGDPRLERGRTPKFEEPAATLVGRVDQHTSRSGPRGNRYQARSVRTLGFSIIGVGHRNHTTRLIH